MALSNLYWDQEGLIDEKTQLQKSHATVPLKTMDDMTISNEKEEKS